VRERGFILLAYVRERGFILLAYVRERGFILLAYVREREGGFIQYHGSPPRCSAPPPPPPCCRVTICRYGTFAYKGLAPIPGMAPLQLDEDGSLDELDDLLSGINDDIDEGSK
jgi:hypothetical protein